jgi:hypothetical protein
MLTVDNRRRIDSVAALIRGRPEIIPQNVLPESFMRWTIEYQTSSSERDRVVEPKRFVIVSQPKWFVIVLDLQIDLVMVALGVALPLTFFFGEPAPWPPGSIVQLVTVLVVGCVPLAAACFAVRFVRGVLAIWGHKWGRKFKLIRMGRFGRVCIYVMAPLFAAFFLLCLLGAMLELVVCARDAASLVLQLIGVLAAAAFMYLFLLCFVLRAIDEGRRERGETKQ